jgi:hypothetical protein
MFDRVAHGVGKGNQLEGKKEKGVKRMKSDSPIGNTHFPNLKKAVQLRQPVFKIIFFQVQ